MNKWIVIKYLFTEWYRTPAFQCFQRYFVGKKFQLKFGIVILIIENIISIYSGFKVAWSGKFAFSWKFLSKPALV